VDTVPGDHPTREVVWALWRELARSHPAFSTAVYVSVGLVYLSIWFAASAFVAWVIAWLATAMFPLTFEQAWSQLWPLSPIIFMTAAVFVAVYIVRRGVKHEG